MIRAMVLRVAGWWPDGALSAFTRVFNAP